MTSVNLVFSTPHTGPPNALVFGADRTGVLSFSATLPAPTLTAILHAEGAPTTGIAFAAVLPAPVLEMLLEYDNVTPNRMHAAASSQWQEGDDVFAQTQADIRSAARAESRVRGVWETPSAQSAERISGFTDSAPTPSRNASGWGLLSPTSAQMTDFTEGMLAHALAREFGWRGALPALNGALSDWQDRIRAPRPDASSGWQPAAALYRTQHATFAEAVRAPRSWAGRHQDAMKPPPGRTPPVIPPLPGEKCYYPPFGNAVHLLFSDAADGTPNLLFVCSRLAQNVATAIIPVRRVYLVLNDVRLRRVDGNLELPAEAFTLTADVDSWTFGFSATLPESALSNLQPSEFGAPVELDATVNGAHYRLLAEKISRNRTFGKSRISITGRGLSAWLADPYSPTLTFTNAQERTAQQLVADVLTTNGVSLGWSVDWRIDDWLVPSGAFSHQGRYIDAVNAIVGAAGAYVQPSPVGKTLRVLPRYPDASWRLSALTPDLEVPSAAVEQDSIAWAEFPQYNAVFVHGGTDGILGHVKRTGTAGDKAAPLVVDPMITAAAAARQRGIAVLSRTGRIATVGLTLPVLPESGVILPGTLVRYVDGATPRVGISRSVNLDSSFARLRQTVALEVPA